MYFIANWKMFGGLNTLNSLHKVVKFKKILKNRFVKLVYYSKYTNSTNDKKN